MDVRCKRLSHLFQRQTHLVLLNYDDSYIFIIINTTSAKNSELSPLVTIYTRHSVGKTRINFNMDSVKILSINDIEECRRLCNGWLSSKETLAVDAEGINLSAQGRLTLLQIGTVDGLVYLLDVINPDQISDYNSGKRLLIDGGIKDVLENNLLLKVMHSCESDCGALHHQFGISVENVFDTQAAALTLQYAEGSLFPIRKPIEELIETYLQRKLNKKDFKEKWLSDIDQYWARRPLTQEAIEYATGDIFFLHSLYEIMNKKLKLHPSLESMYKIYLDIEANGQIEKERTMKKADELKKKGFIQFWDALEQRRNPQPTSEARLSENDRRAVVNFYILRSNGALKTDDKIPPSFYGLIERLRRQIINDFPRMEREGLDREYAKEVYLLSKYSEGELKLYMRKLQWTVKALQAKPGIDELIQNINEGKVRNFGDLNSRGLEALERYRECQEELFRKRYIIPNTTLQRLERELNRHQIEDWEAQAANGTFRENITIKVEMILKTIQRRDHNMNARAEELLRKIYTYKISS